MGSHTNFFIKCLEATKYVSMKNINLTTRVIILTNQLSLDKPS